MTSVIHCRVPRLSFLNFKFHVVYVSKVTVWFSDNSVDVSCVDIAHVVLHKPYVHKLDCMGYMSLTDGMV